MVNIRLRAARARAARARARRGESADKSRASELAVAQSSPDMVFPSPISGFHLLLYDTVPVLIPSCAINTVVQPRSPKSRIEALSSRTAQCGCGGGEVDSTTLIRRSDEPGHRARPPSPATERGVAPCHVSAASAQRAPSSACAILRGSAASASQLRAPPAGGGLSLPGRARQLQISASQPALRYTQAVVRPAHSASPWITQPASPSINARVASTAFSYVCMSRLSTLRTMRART